MLNADLFAAVDLATIAYWTWIVLKVAIGLGAVIFVHELGHFLVAKACGVKCEKFFIGFDIGGYKISRRWGETEYGIGILPLGGYVKMLGQDDDPAHIAEQMQKSQVSAGSPDAVEVTGPQGEKYLVDRRSYLAKSVPQRMAIISAGVVMNVFFAFIFAVIAYGLGVPYQPSVASGTMPGSPAWVAGIGPGDEIVKLGNRDNPSFMQLRGSVTLGDKENGIECEWRRAVDGKVKKGTLRPVQDRGLAKIGMAPGLSLTLYSGQPTIEHSPAARAQLIEMIPRTADLDTFAGGAAFLDGAKVIRVGGVEIGEYHDWLAELARQPDRPLAVTLRRTLRKKSDREAVPENEADEPQEGDITLDVTFEVPAKQLRTLGLVMEMGPIAAVQTDSPAAEAGLAKGDVITAVDGMPLSDGVNGTDSWDPTTLPDYFRKAAIDGRSVELKVRRHAAGDASDDQSAQVRTVSVKPRVPTVYYDGLPPDTPMGVPAIGIAYTVENEIHAVAANGPAAAADVKPGDRIDLAKVIYPQDKKGRTPRPTEFELGSERKSWPTLFLAAQSMPPGTKVEFTIKRNGDSKPVVAMVEPMPMDGQYFAERGFIFETIVRTRTAKTFVQQLQYGWDETTEALLLVYRFLQKIWEGQVPLTALGGPGTIAMAAGGAASQGVSSLLIFLTLLSANLAVINFLPIPLLDGGHMVFLAYEGIRGRPANPRIVVALHMIGFVFIITLMLFVLGLDFGLIERRL